MQKKLFSELGLAPELLKAVAKAGYEEASPIQSEAIPVLLGGADVFGQSQTGSGKTAAYALPAIQRVDATLRAPQVLILCPTRELAVQVAEEMAKLAFFKRGVRELPIYGGQSYERQYRGLQAGSQIIIGTPGRVMDHLQRGSLKLDHLQTVILDEADRMLDMGFIEDIRTILSQMPAERQTVMFSATLPAPIRHLVDSFMRDPVNIRIAAQTLTVPAIEQVYYELDRRAKVEVLCRLIDLDDIKFGLVFCATKMMVDELTEHLNARGYAADKLHGDMSQAMRERVMTKFRKRGIEFLVATDVAARGLDVDDIEVVFNYDLPQDSEDYVHRIGRTGRAGRSGKAITFVAGREIWKLQNIMRATKSKILRARIPTAEEVEQKRESALFDLLCATLESGEYKRYDEWIDRLLDEGHAATDIASALLHLAGNDKPARTAEPLSSIPAPRHEEYPRHSREAAPEPRPRKKRSEAAPYSEEPDLSERIGRKRPAAAPVDREPETHDRINHPRTPKREKGGHRHATAEAGMVRLTLNAGREHDITPGDIVGVIAGVAKVPKEAVGAIRLLARSSCVDVAREHAPHILEKLNGIRFKGRKVWMSPGE